MNHRSQTLATLLFIAIYLSICTTASAASFLCDSRVAVGEPTGVTDIKKLLPAGNALDDPAHMNAAIDTLRQQGLSKTLIIDNLIGAYCPVVAADSLLNDAQRTARVRRFAGRVTRLVYETEDTDEIFLDVPFKPEQVDAINSRSSSDHLSPEAWVAKIATQALASGR